MQQILRTTSFEDYFSAAVLRKGALLSRRQIFLVRKNQRGFHEFLFPGNVKLKLQVRGEQILSWRCSCEINHCEHLAAALFELSGIRLPYKQPGEQSSFAAALKRVKGFIRQRSDGEAAKFLRERKTQLPELCQDFLRETGTDQLSGHLAFLAAASQHLPYLKEMDGEQSEDYGGFLELVDKLKRRPVNDDGRIWKDCLFYAVEKRHLQRSGIWIWLLPRVLHQTLSAGDLQRLKKAFEKEIRGYAGHFFIDWWRVAAWEVRLVKGNERRSAMEPEQAIAAAELLWAVNKRLSALKLLNAAYEGIKNKKSPLVFAFLEYLIGKCKAAGDTQREVKYIAALLQVDPHPRPVYLKRMKQLLGKTEYMEMLKQIIDHLRFQDATVYASHLRNLMMEAGCWKELVKMAASEKLPFSLFNRIAIKLINAAGEPLFRTYLFQLENTLYDAREPFHQREIFEHVKAYLKALPSKRSRQLSNFLLENISRNNYLYSLLKNYSEKNEMDPLSHPA